MNGNWLKFKHVCLPKKFTETSKSVLQHSLSRSTWSKIIAHKSRSRQVICLCKFSRESTVLNTAFLQRASKLQLYENPLQSRTIHCSYPLFVEDRNDNISNSSWKQESKEAASFNMEAKRDSDLGQGLDEVEKEQTVVGDVANKERKYESLEEFEEYDYRYAEGVEEFGYFGDEFAEDLQMSEPELPISLERGASGVFDLEELVIFLEHLGAFDLVHFPIPPEACFCDTMVVASVKSTKQMRHIHDRLFWVHKRKKAKYDDYLTISGNYESSWCAMDMGNIVLHLFHGQETRDYYNLEALWTLGPEADPVLLSSYAEHYTLSPEDLFWLESKELDRKNAALGINKGQAGPQETNKEN